MLGGFALDLHAADRIDRNRRFRINALMLAAAASARAGLRVVVPGVIVAGVMIVVVVVMARLAGPRGLPLHLAPPSFPLRLS